HPPGCTEKVVSCSRPAPKRTGGRRGLGRRSPVGAGCIEIVVNSVGGERRSTSVERVPCCRRRRPWTGLFDLNLLSAVWTTGAALPSLLERGGSIANVSSINSRPVGASPDRLERSQGRR